MLLLSLPSYALFPCNCFARQAGQALQATIGEPPATGQQEFLPLQQMRLSVMQILQALFNQLLVPTHPVSLSLLEAQVHLFSHLTNPLPFPVTLRLTPEALSRKKMFHLL